MIEKRLLFMGKSLNPYLNLAIEQQLLESLPRGCCLLYLWQNKNTVVIGRNQNAWKECKTELLKEEGGLLARRLSGGGAVFHDLGNLNFTFLANREDYDLEKQLLVIQKACELQNIKVEISGRNDLLAQNRKFSGNAFYKAKDKAYHHGTLLINVDMEKLGRYLNPSLSKLKAKGVDSVKSRVINLCEISDITIDSMKEALIESFSSIYGGKPEFISEDFLEEEALKKTFEHNESFEWNYGRKLPFNFSCEERFSFGEIRLEFSVDEGKVQNCILYSDSMDWQLGKLAESFINLPFTKEALLKKAKELSVKEIYELLRGTL